jgi:hypothetical protein
MRSNILKYLKKRLASNRWALDSLARMSVPFSPLMRPGVFFFHQGRCGSSVVADLLNQHPKISSHGEIFNPFFSKKRLPTKPENMLRSRRMRAFPNYSVVEAKFFECQHLSLLGLSISEFVDLIRSCGFRKFIILNRLNYLRKVVSSKIGSERNKWRYMVNEEIPTLITVCLDVENVSILGRTAPIIDLFKYMDEQYQMLRIALGEDDVLELTYEEDIFDDPIVAYTRVCHWLGFENLPVQVRHKKTQSEMELNKIVENWNSVIEALSGTQYAWMMKSDPKLHIPLNSVDASRRS